MHKKAFDDIQYQFMIKAFDKGRLEGTYLAMIKGIYGKTGQLHVRE